MKDISIPFDAQPFGGQLSNPPATRTTPIKSIIAATGQKIESCLQALVDIYLPPASIFSVSTHSNKLLRS